MTYVPERANKNEHQYTKILLFQLTDGEEWEQDLGVWRHKAKPVYRKPQDEWEAATDNLDRWIYFLPKSVVGEPDPESFEFPEWIACRWDSQGGRWVVIVDGGGEGFQAQGTLTDLADGEGHYTGYKVGTVQIVVSPCQPDLVGEEVEVVDWSECIFDHEFEDLEDVWVWFGKGIAESQDPEADPGELTPCHYVTHDRCCVAADGSGSDGGSGGGSDFESF